MGLSPSRRGRGQVHAFGRHFLRQSRFPAEKWTSPQPARERLPQGVNAYKNNHELKVGIKNNRLAAGWNDEYLEQVLLGQ
jgi:hypothetical protein